MSAVGIHECLYSQVDGETEIFAPNKNHFPTTARSVADQNVKIVSGQDTCNHQHLFRLQDSLRTSFKSKSLVAGRAHWNQGSWRRAGPDPGSRMSCCYFWRITSNLEGLRAE